MLKSSTASSPGAGRAVAGVGRIVIAGRSKIGLPSQHSTKPAAVLALFRPNPADNPGILPPAYWHRNPGILPPVYWA